LAAPKEAPPAIGPGAPLAAPLDRWTGSYGGEMPAKVGQVVIAGIPVMVKLGFRLSIAYLRFKGKAKRAASVFERELLAGGMAPDQARALTEMYMESSRLIHIGMKGALAAGPALRRAGHP